MPILLGLKPPFGLLQVGHCTDFRKVVPLPLNQVEIRGPCRVRIPEGTKLRTNPDLTVFDVQKVGPESIGVTMGNY